MSARAITKEQEAEFIQRHATGESYVSMARYYGCHVAAIRKTVTRLNLPARYTGRPRWRTFTDEQTSDIISRWDGGASIAALCREYGTERKVITRLLIENERTPMNRTNIAHGERHGSWKGGRVVGSQGYIQVKIYRDDPLWVMANTSNYVQEHRLVMARHLGRPLSPSESVHHINGDRADNRIENLQLRQGQHGTGIVVKCLDCGSHNISSTEIKG